MLALNKNALSVFAVTSTLQFIGIFVSRVYGIGRLLTRYGPCNLNEIPWLKEIIASIIIGAFCGWIGYKLDKAEKAQGKETHIPRIKFQNFGLAILFFTSLFFGFIFIFVIREYNEYSLEISYMFRKTFWQYCAVEIPWPEIVVTSLIFGVILAIGFSKTPDKAIENKTEKE